MKLPRSYTIKVHPIFGLMLMLIIFAGFLCIPVLAFYVAPKALVWLFNWPFVHLMGLSGLPFNLFTWAIAMYLLWMVGAVRLTFSGLKTALGEITSK